MSWNIDQAHTAIQFAVKHMMLAKVRGQFEKFDGTVSLDEANPAATKIDIQIETASVNTRDGQRDGHLRSADFFNSEKFPYMTFVSKKVDFNGGTTAKLVGDLTIRDITREVVLDVDYVGKSKSPWGSESLGFTASTSIPRKEWDLTWNKALETGGVLVGEDIDINIELELKQS